MNIPTGRQTADQDSAQTYFISILFPSLHPRNFKNISFKFENQQFWNHDSGTGKGAGLFRATGTW